MSEVFQYMDGSTKLHEFNPLTKIIFCTLIIITGIVTSDLLILAGLLALPIIGLIIAGMAKEIKGQLKMLTVVFLFLVLITVLTVRTGEPVAGISLITIDGLLLGVIISLRLASMFFAFLLLVTTTKPTDLVNTLVSKAHFPIDYALMLMITLRFIPTLQIDARRIREAQAVRGFSASGISGIPKSIGPTITPLLSNSIGRAGSLGHIIELRGYRSGSKIKFTDLPLAVMDIAVILLMVAGSVAYIAYVFGLF